jgi:cytochrome c oxidase assembly protein subunit 11
MSTHPPPSKLDRSNRRIALLCAVFFASMVGAAFASVPLYDLFCRATGYGGTTRVASAAPDRTSARHIKVRFDANVAPDLPWEFTPELRERNVALGETVLVNFKVKNISDRKTWGTASYNVTPELVGSYFAKLQCFCFTQQSLNAGETMNMPVVFFVDPALNDNADLNKTGSMTLSYTFFATKPSGPVARADGPKPVKPQFTLEYFPIYSDQKIL